MEEEVPPDPPPPPDPPNKINQYECQSQRPNELASVQLQKIILNKPSHIKFFTDGSVDGEGSAGFGVFSPEINYSYTSRLPNYTQICAAEIVAINHALQIILKNGIKQAIICSDSKSAIQKIGRSTYSMETEHSSFMTKRGIIEAKENTVNISLAWIPGHSNIKGNMVADKLANIGRTLNVAAGITLHYSNFLPDIKHSIWNR
ncbi:uncharacterized protein LOC126886263 [Diabrotica virgifera virgifera]|uniref:RNase H type-1 domain-containing protein n=1 Tax=Diabrotica virgifera virgifera TaxID=50390 RepID=A0ABM5KFW5_DIAVI|nr:uncharacterized protein LOC126886263 [Diabrotica virgifera virgifera]